METAFVQPPGGDIKIWMRKNLLGEIPVEESKKRLMINEMAIPGIKYHDVPLNEFMDTVERFICEEFRMSLLHFKASSKIRKQEYVICRQVFYFLIKKYRPKVSTLIIGLRYMKDHSTVLHGIYVAKNMIDTDKYFRASIKNLSERIEKFYPN